MYGREQNKVKYYSEDEETRSTYNAEKLATATD